MMFDVQIGTNLKQMDEADPHRPAARAERQLRNAETLRSLAEFKAFPDPSPEIPTWIMVRKVTLMEACRVIDIARRHATPADIGATARYTSKDLREAKYLPLRFTGSAWIDTGSKGERLNAYRSVGCQACGRRDWADVPSPFVIKQPSKSGGFGMYEASNGVIVLTTSLWNEISKEMDKWVLWGPVSFMDSPRIATDE